MSRDSILSCLLGVEFFVGLLPGVGGVDVGLMGQGGLMYYPADNQDNDHWYGLAPSLAIGLVVH